MAGSDEGCQGPGLWGYGDMVVGLLDVQLGEDCGFTQLVKNVHGTWKMVD